MQTEGMFFNGSQMILMFFSIKLGGKIEHTPTNNKKIDKHYNSFEGSESLQKGCGLPGGIARDSVATMCI